MMLGSSPSLVAKGSELLIPRGSTVFGDLHSGHAAEGQNSPESDTDYHLGLYREIGTVGCAYKKISFKEFTHTMTGTDKFRIAGEGRNTTLEGPY